MGRDRQQQQHQGIYTAPMDHSYRANLAGDNGSRDLLEDILKSEEDHIDWIEEQLELIKQVGEAHYLAQQIKEEDA